MSTDASAESEAIIDAVADAFDGSTTAAECRSIQMSDEVVAEIGFSRVSQPHAPRRVADVAAVVVGELDTARPLRIYAHTDSGLIRCSLKSADVALGVEDADPDAFRYAVFDALEVL